MALPPALRDALLGEDYSAIAVRSDEDAYRFCRHIAFHHYENFPVASLAFGRMRDDIAAIYAFARLADDVADELQIPSEQKLVLLDEIERWLDAPPDGHPIARAIVRTVQRNALPDAPLRRLLWAFRYDAAFRPFATEQELLLYCHHSAAPIGELLLRLANQWQPTIAPASDAFCAGLQVLNFWQDVAQDWQRGRVTAPLAWLGGEVPPRWEQVRQDTRLCEELSCRYDALTTQLLAHGRTVVRLLRQRRLRLQTYVTICTAEVVLDRCRKRGKHLDNRPRLQWSDLLSLLVRLVFGPKL
ncbi:MAG: squalene/phytoene synthase family protein [Bacteroidota bacterium]|nr:squalene/phytoene synthase family protein [Candidatus Kapabacteria bacterium]MCS7301893.1 squalene/phytoene synthase family protein [Candidatus Kapabacteria bacterium]MCX7936146.1 squalene/phytoene synthase family protein [Chlorobiota bacterium]MDW8074960.1 squalene/phytoene synthase family protein [Bacteroidota bacterium]MDW8271599.1 squalene/phytoene synthase family protein [Bacteroidota bacterium]